MFIVFYYIPFNDENEIEGTWNEFNFLFSFVWLLSISTNVVGL